MNKNFLIALLAFIVSVSVLIFNINRDQDIEPEPQVSSWHSEHCLIATTTPGEDIYIEEGNPGKFNYTIMQRADGSIEVWQDRSCE
jgi:hypothetical protein